MGTILSGKMRSQKNNLRIFIHYKMIKLEEIFKIMFNTFLLLDEKIEILRSEMIYPSSHYQLVADLGLEPKLFGSLSLLSLAFIH